MVERKITEVNGMAKKKTTKSNEDSVETTVEEK
jgi:hypothetical protein